MTEQNVFDRRSIEMDSMSAPDGLLEQLNLPPALIKFLRQNSKAVWAVVICVTIIVVTVSLYGSYRAYRLDKAASALDAAIESSVDRAGQLKGVIEEYGSTPAALWAKVELVSLYDKEGEHDKAVHLLQEIDAETPEGSSLKPLITYKIGTIYEKQGVMEKALGMYTVLSQMAGFEAQAYKAMGLVNDKLGNNDQAVAMYRKYLEQLGDKKAGLGADPARMVIEARLNALEQKK